MQLQTKFNCKVMVLEHLCSNFFQCCGAWFRIHWLHLLGDEIGNAEGTVSLEKLSVIELNKNRFSLTVQQFYMLYALPQICCSK
jgi:hypothetical protein